MDITIIGRNVGITDRFRSYATEKAEKVEQLADRALALEVRLCRHHEKSSGPSGNDRVELTLIGPGPVVRAEADGQDKYAALDIALGKLLERVRRAKDRRKVHRGQHRPATLREADHFDFNVADITPAEAATLNRVNPSTGAISVPEDASSLTDSRSHSASAAAPTARGYDESVADDENGDEAGEDYSPVVIRRKVFASMPMTVDDALYYMELVGHDFYLFQDSETGRPSVVYRRKGWDYGVIGLDENADQLQEVVTATRALQR